MRAAMDAQQRQQPLAQETGAVRLTASIWFHSSSCIAVQRPLEHDAGIVDQHVDAAICWRAASSIALRRFRRPDRRRPNKPALVEFGRQRLALRDQTAAPASIKRAADTEADALAAAGDDRHLACERAHESTVDRFGAADLDDFAADVTRIVRREKGNDVGNFLGFGDMTQRHGLAQFLDRVFGIDAAP